MNGQSKLTHQSQEQTQHQQATQQQAGQEFNSVEEMLRFDAAQQPVPESVGERLQASVDREGLAPPRPWWKRLWGK